MTDSNATELHTTLCAMLAEFEDAAMAIRVEASDTQAREEVWRNAIGDLAREYATEIEDMYTSERAALNKADSNTILLLKKLLFDLRRLEYEVDKPGSDMTLGDYEREEIRLIEECAQAVATTFGRGECEMIRQEIELPESLKDGDD